VIFAHLIQAASSLPTDASALESSISALERAISALESEIATLESSSVPWEHRLPWFTGLVVFGVVIELLVIGHEYHDEMETWASLTFFGVLRRPSRPSAFKVGVEIVSVLLITFGIVGELWIGIEIASINGSLRGKSAQLRSKNAELRTASDQLVALVTSEAEEVKKQAKAADLARVQIEARVAWRHLSEKQKADIGTKLGDFSNQEGASFWYLAGDTEAAMFASDLAESLKLVHVVVQPPADITVMHGTGKFGDPIRRIDTGVSLQSTKDERSRLLADSIIRELIARGFDAVRQTDPSFNDSPVPQVWVMVNPRPEGPQGEYKLQAERDAKAKKKQANTNQPAK
jgi:hypothetical protein